MTDHIRNIAIIAHVDHGKTTLVDKLLVQSGSLGDRAAAPERVMDSNDLERERGITILSKNTAIHWKDYHINIVDTPGHADFGGEVERVLSMVDSVLLLVDAVDGPMPQTRFVTQKAFAMGFKPLVVINKVDRPSARPSWVLDQTFELFDRLGATDEQLDFPVIYCSALNGFASLDQDVTEGNLDPLYEAIIEHVSPPNVDLEGPLQMQVSTLDYNAYQGVIGIGRITRGTMLRQRPLTIIKADGKTYPGKVQQIYEFQGLLRAEVDSAQAGEIVAITGIDGLDISDTLCDPNCVEARPPLTVDEPTISMTFQANTSPFSGQDGKYVTSRRLKERLDEELQHNVALRVEQTSDMDRFKVSGRGELHLAILIETLRRESFEILVSRPQVVLKKEGDQTLEPYERLTVDVESDHQGSIMEKLSERKGMLQDMQPDGKGRVRLEFIIPSRGLIGFRTDFMTTTSGTGLLYHSFDHYGPHIKQAIGQRNNGVLIANAKGKALGFALFNLQERGRLLVKHGDEVYEGMLIGIHSRGNDLVVNCLKAKQLTNMRAAGTDENLVLSPPIVFTLEQALEFVDDDELVEVTPSYIRLRKKLLTENERKRADRSMAS